jgi:hypothetical protein
MRDIVSAMTPAEFKTLFEQSEFTIGFAACQSDQLSHGVHSIQHGAWSYHLARVLRGEEVGAIEKGSFVTGRSLQSFLFKHVPPFVRQNVNPKVVQTPCAFGNMTAEFIVADVGPILAALAVKQVPLTDLLKLAVFRGGVTGSLRKLSGWKQGHFVPTKFSDGDDFVRSIGEKDILPDAERIFDRLKGIFSYKRLEATLTPGEGGALIRAPHFEIEFDIGLNPSAFSEFEQRIVLKEISDGGVFTNPKFNALLEREIDEVVLAFSNQIKVADVVDALEAAGHTPDYDSAVTYCKFALPEGKVRFEAEKLTFRNSGASTPAALWKAFTDFYPRLSAIAGLPKLSFA